MNATNRTKTIEIKTWKKAGRRIKWHHGLLESAIEAAIRMSMRDDRPYFVFANALGYQIKSTPIKFQGNYKVSVKGDEAEIESIPYNLN